MASPPKGSSTPFFVAVKIRRLLLFSFLPSLDAGKVNEMMVIKQFERLQEEDNLTGHSAGSSSQIRPSRASSCSPGGVAHEEEGDAVDTAPVGEVGWCCSFLTLASTLLSPEGG